MLTLMLLRHAKAGAQQGDDFSRTLTEKGVVDASVLGKHLADRGLLPDISLVSSALRTRQTFELFASAAGRPLAARFEAGLYNATEQHLRNVLRQVDAGVVTLMLVGHNPGIMDAAAALARDGDPDDLARLHSRFPPCGLAVITFDADDWQDARAGAGRLDLFSTPEDLAARG